MSQQIANRDWHTRARVRILKERASYTPAHTVRTFRPGEELEMIQWGRAGREVDRSRWWTSYDLDGAHIIDADKVEVIEVIDEVAP